MKYKETLAQSIWATILLFVEQTLAQSCNGVPCIGSLLQILSNVRSCVGSLLQIT
jgi:hypothetical protein